MQIFQHFLRVLLALPYNKLNYLLNMKENGNLIFFFLYMRILNFNQHTPMLKDNKSYIYPYLLRVFFYIVSLNK